MRRSEGWGWDRGTRPPPPEKLQKYKISQKKVSEYDQEIPQSQTADKPVVSILVQTALTITKLPSHDSISDHRLLASETPFNGVSLAGR